MKYLLTLKEERSISVKSGDNNVDINVVESFENRFVDKQEVVDLIGYYTDSEIETQKCTKTFLETGQIEVSHRPYSDSPYYKTLTAIQVPA